MLRKYHLLVSISIVNSQGFGVVISMKKKKKKNSSYGVLPN